MEKKNQPISTWVGEKPKIGDTIRSKDIGRSGRPIYIWDACPDCGKERWIKRNTQGARCISCATRISAMGSKNHRWNGGRRHDPKHGIYIYVKPDHPLFSIENLELLPSQANHLPYCLLQSEMKGLQKRVTVLEAENILLRTIVEAIGNPELADSNKNRASVETLHGASLVDEEKVHPHKKL